jgi:hypothetical protein
MLSCSSTKASICGLALSWKYSPQALGASHETDVLEKAESYTKVGIANITLEKCESDTLEPEPLLCNGKLVNA